MLLGLRMSVGCATSMALRGFNSGRVSWTGFTPIKNRGYVTLQARSHFTLKRRKQSFAVTLPA